MPPRTQAARLLASYVALCERRGGALLAAFGLLCLLCAWPISRLELHTDFAELLPDTHPAVVALRRVAPRQISSTNLVLLVGSPDPQASRRFVDALRAPLGALVPSVFSEIQWRPETEVPAFFSRYRWLYAERADLESAERLLERLEASRRLPGLVDLEGDPERELRELRARLSQQLPAQTDAPYFEARDPGSGLHYAGVMLWRRGDGLATIGDQRTLEVVRQVVGRLDPRSFHPQLRVEYSGHITMALEEQAAVRADLGRATLVCVSAVLLVIYLHFRRLAVLVAVGAPAILGVLLSLGLAQLTSGALNANTAFLVSIILGNGINAPIVLLARYGEERRRGLPAAEALAAALHGALLGTLTAMAAASVAYGSLLVTNLRGLSQFGLLGGCGMLLVWLLTFALVPPLLLCAERLRPGLMTPRPGLLRGPFSLVGRAAARAPWALAAAAALLCAAAALPAWRYAKDPLEYDWSKLRNVNKDGDRRWGVMYALGMGNVGGGYIARDGVILVDRPEQADAVADALWRQDQALGARAVLEAVRTLGGMLPKEQEEKLAILRRLRARVLRNLHLLDEDERREVQAWLPPEDLRPLRLPDLPRRLRENFTEVDGTVGRLVGIDADPRRYGDPYGESDGRSLQRLARSLQVRALGQTWVAASVSTVFAGMLEIIERDGPKVTLAALLGVVLLLLGAFGPRGAAPVLGAILFGLLWLFGLLGLLGLKLNFLNFVALPITLGVGADYAANLWARLRDEGLGRLQEILADTGAAVALCSVTTVIGYSSLLLASNRALQTFGLMADLGEVTCLLSALLALPAFASLGPVRRWLRL